MLVISLGGMDSSAMSKTRVMDYACNKGGAFASQGHAIIIKHAKWQEVGPLVGYGRI
jgi:hypothetical protein